MTSFKDQSKKATQELVSGDMAKHLMAVTEPKQTTILGEPLELKLTQPKMKLSEILPVTYLESPSYSTISAMDFVLKPLKMQSVREEKKFRIKITEILYEYCKEHKLL